MAGGVPAGRLSIEIVAEIARLQQDMDRVKKLVNAASGDIARSAKAANDNLAGMARGIASAGASGKLASHHMANLSFQLQDIIVGLQSGQKPMTVFLQQGSQIGQIMMQAGVGVGGLAKALLQMAAASVVAIATNPALLAAAAAIGLIATTVGLVTDEINKNSDVTVTWQDVLLGAFDVVKAAISERVTSAFEAMGLDIGNVWDTVVKYTKTAINLMIGAIVYIPKTIAAIYDKIPAAFGDAFYSAANLAIDALNKLAKMAAAPLNLIIGGFNKAFGTTIPEIVIGGLSRIANPYAGAMATLGRAYAGAVVGAFTTDYVGGIASALSGAAQNRARLREAAEKGGKDVGKAAGKAAGRAAAKAAGDEFGANFAIELINSLGAYGLALSKAMQPVVDALKAEQIAEFDKKLQAANDNAIQGADAAAAASQAWNAQLRETIDLLDQIGGMAGALGDIGAVMYGLKTGDFSGVSGKAGALVQTLAGITWKSDSGEIKKLGEEVSRFLEGVEIFGSTATELLRGAGTGYASGTLAFGSSAATQFGSLAGGAFGQVAGEKFLASSLNSIAKGLGDFAGPIGSIVGGLLGGALGSLFKKSKSKANVLTEAGQSGTFGGTGGDYTRAADALSQSVLTSLDKIAKALGATADGAFKLSIGMRDGNYVVNPTGGGTKASMGAVNFGKDEAAAIAFAIQDAISDGVFQGLGEGVERLLKSGGDLETQLQKALSFKGVFDELEKLKDPQGYALKGLDQWRAGMDAIFAEAGATADELARLEELTGLKRAEIVAKYAEDATEIEKRLNSQRVVIMELEGNAAGALALARQMELASMTEAEQVLQQRIYTLQDEATAMAAAKAIADERAGIEREIIQMQGDTAALRRQELEALDPANRALKDYVYTLQDAADAAEKATAIQREGRDLQIRLAEALGDTAKAEQMRKEDFLSSVDPMNRAIAETVWQAEKAATAMQGMASAWQSGIAGIEAYYEARAVEAEYLQAANDNLTSSMQETIDKFRGFSDELLKFRNSLYATEFAPDRSLGALRAQYSQTAMRAARGDEAALGGLPDIARQYLDMAKMQASTRQQYEAIVQRVIGDVESAAGTADSIADHNRRQMEALTGIRDGIDGLRTDVAALQQENQQLRAEVQRGNANQKRAADALSDASGGGYLMTKEVA